MKKHSLYKWFRRVAMLSGIPALTMMFACMEKYGAPNDVIWGAVLDQETDQLIPEVIIQDEDGHPMDTTGEYGQFELTTSECVDLTFSKEGYHSKDTTLCPPTDGTIYLKKIAKE